MVVMTVGAGRGDSNFGGAAGLRIGRLISSGEMACDVSDGGRSNEDEGW